MKSIEDINLHTWFSERELKYIPSHFVMVNSAVTSESRQWVLEKLQGRFATASTTFDVYSHSLPKVRIAFEDPKEAVFYELTWS
jgi:hypothetical protein